jgi:hypothetical protein
MEIVRMNACIRTVALFSLLVCGCGGLKHIPDVRSETRWRALDRLDPQVQPANREFKPPPTEVPYRAVAQRGAYVAVFDIHDKGNKLTPMEIDGLTDYLASKLAEDGLFHVVPRDEIKRRLLEQKEQSYKECYDQSCQIEVGREIAAQKTLSVTIAPIGTKCVVTAVLYDLKKGASDATASSRDACAPDKLVEQIEAVVNKLRKMVK